MKTLHQKYMDALAYMNSTMKADNAAGHQWRYCNTTSKKAKNFQSARKQGKYLLNCVDGVQWACKIAGIPSNALAWYGSHGIAWCGSGAQANAKKYFKIIKIGSKTVRQCYDEGLLCQGDILTYMNISHTNAYYKGGKSFDSGHAYCSGSGEGAKFTKWIGTLKYQSNKIAFILRIKDRKHYRVQAGAYNDPNEAAKQVKLLKSKGFAATTIKEDGMTKVQAGYFDGKENAEKLLQKLKAKKINAFIKEI